MCRPVRRSPSPAPWLTAWSRPSTSPTTPHTAERLQEEWPRSLVRSSDLVVIESPYRSLAGPLPRYIDALHESHPEDALVIVLPEYVPSHWWGHLLHNQTALRLKAALLFHPGVIVAR